MQIFASRAVLVGLYVGVHSKTSLMSSSLLFLQCPGFSNVHNISAIYPPAFSCIHFKTVNVDYPWWISIQIRGILSTSLFFISTSKFLLTWNEAVHPHPPHPQLVSLSSSCSITFLLSLLLFILYNWYQFHFITKVLRLSTSSFKFPN